MDKISGILPASPRTQAADVSASQPARPGAPMTGRPEGRNSLGDRITFSKELEKMRMQNQNPERSSEAIQSGPQGQLTSEVPEQSPTYKNTAENSKLKMIQEMNKRFFSNPKEIARENAGVTRSEEVLKNIEESEPIVAPRVPQENRGLQANRGEILP